MDNFIKEFATGQLSFKLRGESRSVLDWIEIAVWTEPLHVIASKNLN